MADLSVFRFAKSPQSGWTTAAGMYVGHYIAWIAAALLYAVYLKSPEAQAMLQSGLAPPVAPGPLAYNAIGFLGIMAVILAGWTTANPTIYRAGLAFQAVLPRLSTFWVTILTGLLATIAGLFPAFAMKLLGFVALYGFILAPIGAIIVFNHFFLPKSEQVQTHENQENAGFNWSVFLAWALSCGFFYYISIQWGIFLSYLTLPTWLACGALYLLLRKWL